MVYPSFCAGAYLSQSPAVDGEQSINLYPSPVKAEGGTGKNDWWLNSAPGKFKIATLDDSPGRAIATVRGQNFGVAGTHFYVLNLPNPKRLGVVAADPGPAQIIGNTSTAQTFVISGGQGYIWDGQNFTNPVQAMQGAFMDGFFFAMQPGNGNTIFYSAVNDGTQWNSLQSFQKLGGADPLVAIGVDHELIWLLGSATTDLFYNTGQLNNPFQRISGGVLPIGIAAPWSLATIPDALAPPGGLIWFGSDDHGTGVVVRSAGQSTQRVSNHAIEAEIASYSAANETISNAVGYVYEEWGHVFYCLTFPSAYNGLGVTWVYDLTTGYWHRRGQWDSQAGQYRADKASCHTSSFGTHYVLDYRNGNMYQQGQFFYTDDTDPIRRLRSAPHITNEAKWMFYHGFQLDMQTGLQGTPPYPPIVNANPVAVANPTCILQYSNDGGYTWSNELQMSTGQLGQYRFRVKKFRLGRSRDRAFRVIQSDPIPIAWVNAYLDVEAGA